MDTEELARFWSEWTDDDAPLNLGVYRSAADRFLKKYDVTPKEPTDG